MIARPPSLDVTSPIKRLPPPPAIYWPTAAGFGDSPDNSADSRRFPTLAAMNARRGADPVAPLNAFIDAVAAAQERVFILDGYLFKPNGDRPLQPRIDQILDWLPITLEANDVRLLTSSIGAPADKADITQQLCARASEVNSLTRYRLGTIQIEVKFTLQYVHDRFAIIDDELWHFGATVGGLHNEVNAASRGWNVDDHNAIQFFETAWLDRGQYAQSAVE